MLEKTINVAIVDDHTLFRKTLKRYISEHRNMNVVVQSPDMNDLLPKLKDFEVNVLLMDLFLPELSGNDAVKLIREEFPDIKILILSMCTDMDLLSSLIDPGVYGVISKADEPEEVIRAIISLSEHRIYRNKLFTEVMYWSKQNNLKVHAINGDNLLRNREIEILQLLWNEKSNKEIADHLYLSVRSVEKIRQDMKEKLGVKSTVGLLKYAINQRLISVSSPFKDNNYNRKTQIGRLA
jgi:DNA-binding NarL/FixJ family response regulator